MDWPENTPQWIAVGAIAGILAVSGWAIWKAATADSFSLPKNDWECSQESIRTTITPLYNGQTTKLLPIAHSECDQYTRKK